LTEVVFHPIGATAARTDIAVSAGAEEVVPGYFEHHLLYPGPFVLLRKLPPGDLVDFVPPSYKGIYTIFVGLNKFEVEVNLARKSGPLLVEFECPSDCEATVTTETRARYLPTMAAEAHRMMIRVLYYDASAAKARRINAALCELGYDAYLVRLDAPIEGYRWSIVAGTMVCGTRLCARHMRFIYSMLKQELYEDMVPPTLYYGRVHPAEAPAGNFEIYVGSD
jgi:hypothetical protein